MIKSARTLKAINLTEGRVMTMNNKAIEMAVDNLCDHCAFSLPFDKFKQCWVNRDSEQTLKSMGINQQITYCALHQPIIAFKRPLVGFDSVFNTFRPGSAWYSRLIENDVVGLMDVDSGELFCKTQVIAIDTGLMNDMITKHGHMNHIIIHNRNNDLKKVLVRLYGPRIIHDQAKVSVITLKRLI